MNEETKKTLLKHLDNSSRYGRRYMFVYNRSHTHQYLTSEGCKELAIYFSTKHKEHQVQDKFVCAPKETFSKVSEILKEQGFPEIKLCLEHDGWMVIDVNDIENLATLDILITLIKSFKDGKDWLKGVSQIYPNKPKAAKVYEYYLNNPGEVSEIKDCEFALCKNGATRSCSGLGLLAYTSRVKRKSAPKIKPN